MKKRLLYLLLILITLISSMTVIAYATESGSCGTNLKWTLSDAGVLTISGSGEMKEFEEINYESDRYCRDTPWRNYRDNIKKYL